MSLVTTPHINADKDAFAKTVLMPGDPLRSKFYRRKFSSRMQFWSTISEAYRDTRGLTKARGSA